MEDSWYPRGIKEIKPELIENRTYFEDLSESIQDSMEGLKDRLMYSVLAKRPVDGEFLIAKVLLKELERKVARLKRKGTPPLCTHNIYNEDNDIILYMNLLPFEPLEKVTNPSGIRIGVQEMTRFGMKEREMEKIAELFKKCLKDTLSVNHEVRELRSTFQKVQYSFDE